MSVLLLGSNMQKSFEEIKIPVPWGHISGKWWGQQDKQPIIALHARTENCGSFDPIAPLLSAESILCLDLPGHGFSSPLPSGHCYYPTWDGVLYLRLISKHYKWQEVKLLGHCMGAEIACLYAAIYPKDVKFVININGVLSAAYLNEQSINWAVISVDLALDFASKIRCPYLNVRALSGKNLDEKIYNSLLDAIRQGSSKFVFQEVKGSHHVHINEPEKIAPLINDFIQSLTD